MYSFIIQSKFDNYTIEKKKLIKFAFEHLIENLGKLNIASEIIITDMGSSLGKLSDQNIFRNSSFDSVKVRILSFKNISHKSKSRRDFNFRNFISDVLNVTVPLTEYDNVIIKAQDTLFNDSIFEFLKNKNNNNIHYFYNTFRFDAKYEYSKVNEKKFIDTFSDDKNLLKKKFLEDQNNFYFMKLHTNACGDFILFNKKYFKDFHAPNYPFFNDLFIVYDLYFSGGTQKIIETGKVYKLKNKSAFSNNISTMQLNPFQKKLEYFLHKISLDVKIINILRGIFNYPKLIFNKQKIDSYERYVYLRILLRKFKLINKFKKKNTKLVVDTIKTI